MPTKKPDLKFDAMQGLFLDANGNVVETGTKFKHRPVSRDQFELDTRSVFTKDQSMIMDEQRRVQKDSDGYLVSNAGKKKLKVSPRKTYRRNTRWVVVGELVRMEAMAHYGAGANGGAIWSGWSRQLPVGTIVTCIGWRQFRKDGLVAPQFVYDGLPAEAKYSQVWPLDGVWRPWPLEGILEPLCLDDTEAHLGAWATTLQHMALHHPAVAGAANREMHYDANPPATADHPACPACGLATTDIVTDAPGGAPAYITCHSCGTETEMESPDEED